MEIKAGSVGFPLYFVFYYQKQKIFCGYPHFHLSDPNQSFVDYTNFLKFDFVNHNKKILFRCLYTKIFYFISSFSYSAPKDKLLSKLNL